MDANLLHLNYQVFVLKIG